MVTLGGDDIRSRVRALRQVLKVSVSPMRSDVYRPGISDHLRSLLICHSIGLRLVLNHISAAGDSLHSEVRQFIEETCVFDVYAMELHMNGEPASHFIK